MFPKSVVSYLISKLGPIGTGDRTRLQAGVLSANEDALWAGVVLVDPNSGGAGGSLRTFGNNADNSAVVADRLLGTVNFSYGFDGVTWDRLRSFAGDADNVAAPALGLLGNASFQFLFDGATYDRARSIVDNADALAVGVAGLAGTISKLQIFNGTTYDRVRSGSAANVSAAQSPSPLLVSAPGDWSVENAAADNTIATITRAAGGAGVRHVCTSITAAIAAAGTAVGFVARAVLRDGATGVGTILWSKYINIPGSAQTAGDAQLSGLNIVGSVNTAMTLEFVAAGGADTFESVALTGHDVI